MSAAEVDAEQNSNVKFDKICNAKFEFRHYGDGKYLGCAQVAMISNKDQFINGDCLDEIFDNRWNLPPPNLIISVTGCALEWSKEQEKQVSALESSKEQEKQVSALEWSKEQEKQEAAAARFIKNCIYATAIDSKCCWIVNGGSNSGIMRLLGDARRRLGGLGDYVRLGTSQIPLIGIGVASKMAYIDRLKIKNQRIVARSIYPCTPNEGTRSAPNHLEVSAGSIQTQREVSRVERQVRA
jgi:hypothetical protein